MYLNLWMILVLALAYTEATPFTTRQECSEFGDEESNMIACPDQSTCIYEEFVCDGYNDCENGEEEDLEFCNAVGIEPHCYQPDYIPCPYQVQGNLNCIPSSSLCDGIVDCSNGEDENSTLCNGVTSCEDEGLINCPNSGICIYEEFVCDGYNDCGNGQEEDLEFCNAVGIEPHCYQPDYIPCPYQENDYKCIPLIYACDGIPDCTNNSDENQTWCDSLPLTACSDMEFICEENPHTCLPLMYKCDLVDDCLDGSDEKNCSDTQMSIDDEAVNLMLRSNDAENKQHGKRRESRMHRDATKIKSEKNGDAALKQLLKTKATQLRKEKKNPPAGKFTKIPSFWG